MTHIFKLPDLGENIEQGTVVDILVATGDPVENGQVVIEIETDKSVVEIPIDSRGVVEKVVVSVGDMVVAGAELFELNTSTTAVVAQVKPVARVAESATLQSVPVLKAAAGVKAAEGLQAVTAAPQEALKYDNLVDIAIPDLGKGRTQALINNIPVARGDIVQKGQTLLEIETDKFVLELAAEFDGQVTELIVAQGDEVVSGQLALRIATAARPPLPVSDEGQATEMYVVGGDAAVANTAGLPHEQLASNAVVAGPATRRLGRALGVDLQGVAQNLGRERLDNDDVTAYARALIQGVAGKPAAACGSAGAHGWLQAQVDMTELAAWLQQRNQSLDLGDIPMVTTALMVKAMVMALAPLAERDLAVEVTMAQAQGMLSTTVVHAGQQRLEQIIRQLNLAADKSEETLGQSAAVTLVDLAGSGLQSLSVPVKDGQLLNVVMGTSWRAPRYVDDAVQPRLWLPVSLSFDLRRISLVQGSAYLQRLQGLLQDPIAFAFGI